MKKNKKIIMRSLIFGMMGLMIFSCQKEDIDQELQNEKAMLEEIKALVNSKRSNTAFSSNSVKFTRVNNEEKKGNILQFESLEDFSNFLDDQNSAMNREGATFTHEGILTGGGGEASDFRNYERNIDFGTYHHTTFLR